MRKNLALLTDSYKVSHWKQYRPGTTSVYSYFESRGGQFPTAAVVGLQILLKKYLTQRVTKDDVDYAASRWAKHFNDPNLFNRDGWMHIVNKHGGKLPLRIMATPEGLSVPVSNVLMTVENTDLQVPWLTNWFETLLSQVWYPSTVFTSDREVKRIIKRYLDANGDPAGLLFKLHDFGFRGVSSVESAGVGGMAHLVNFMGTDTAEAFEYVLEYYSEDMAGFSIPAAEHSTITSWGGPEFEHESVANIIQQFGDSPTGLYAIVGDSYDIINFCQNIIGDKLKHKVLAAKNTLVARPDSGIPEQVDLDVIEALGYAFGYSINSKGFKVLNKVRMIQGDGIKWITEKEHTIERILSNLALKGWSADNIAFGSGGGLLQNVNRDTQKFAFKCSSTICDGREVDVWKQPITDSAKSSKRGRLKLVNDPNLGYITLNEKCVGENILQEKYLNGEITLEHRFGELRASAAL